MRQVKIADLKAHLSAYLAAVRAGETIEVCDRNTPIARLEPILEEAEELAFESAREPARVADVPRIPLAAKVNLAEVLAEVRSDRDLLP